MSHGYCVENCSNNAKSQPNRKFSILPSDKQWCQYWLQAVNGGQQCLSFCTLRLVDQLCKGSVFL